jgi:hemoglobin
MLTRNAMPGLMIALLAATAAAWACCVPAFGDAAGTLYSRLGGDRGVTAIAAELIDRAAADPKLGRSFKDTNLKRIKKLLGEQLCELAAGPCRYSGDSMKEVHAGLHISQSEFYTMVDLLRDILRRRNVDLASTNELLRLLAPMKRDFV